MIKVQNLAKLFGAKRAVDGITFSVERGEVLGFLGPNGAGKSTSMRMITGFIPPSVGTITVGGFDMVEDPIPAKRLIGYLPENAPAYTDMTVSGFTRASPASPTSPRAGAWIEAFLEMMAAERAAAANTLKAYGKDLADAIVAGPRRLLQKIKTHHHDFTRLSH